MVVGEVLRIVSGSLSKDDKNKRVDKTADNKLGKTANVLKAGRKGLPKWYRPRYRSGSKNIGQMLIDLDGPLKTLAPYIGKGSIKKHQQKRAQQISRESKGK